MCTQPPGVPLPTEDHDSRGTPGSPPPEGLRTGCWGLITPSIITSPYSADKIQHDLQTRSSLGWWVQAACALCCHTDMKYAPPGAQLSGIPREEPHFWAPSAFPSIYGTHLSETMGAAIEYILTTNRYLLCIHRFLYLFWIDLTLIFWLYETFADSETSFLRPLLIITWASVNISSLASLLLILTHSSLSISEFFLNKHLITYFLIIHIKPFNDALLH